jgi:hypothetical protein
MSCVLRVNFSGNFSKCLQVCLAIFLKTEWTDLKEVSSSFWLETKWWLCVCVSPAPAPYSPDHTPCDLCCTHGWRRFWNGGVLLTLQRFNGNCCRPLTTFLLKILDNASSSGSIAGIAVSSHRGSALKGTKVSNLYDYVKYIFLTIPEILGPPSYRPTHVHAHTHIRNT